MRLFYILSLGALMQGMLLITCGRSLNVQDLVDGSAISTILETEWKVPHSAFITTEPHIAIFYNIYTAPGNSSLTLDIVNEQLNTWRESGIAQTSSLYYALLGEEIEVPCNVDETCKRLEDINSKGNEEETLQGLHDYCASHHNDTVVYIHTKGSFHDSPENRVLRHLSTNAVFSDTCLTIGQNKDECDVCSARFSPLPHWHTSGNMFVAQCSHVGKLIAPKNFQEVMDQVTGEAEKVYPQWKSSADWFVGSKRYANEHWVHTHPELKPCDVYTGDWTWDYTVDLKIDGPFERASAPRFPREKYQLMEHPGHWMNIGYRLLEMQILYKEIPPPHSWVWDFYLKGGKIRRGLPGLRQWNISVWKLVPPLQGARANPEKIPAVSSEDSVPSWLHDFYLKGVRLSQPLRELWSPKPTPAAPHLLDNDKTDEMDSSLVILPPRAPDLSIIILTFNNSDRLGFLLDSLLRQQTNVAYELIIADNGCRDETRNVVHSKLNGIKSFEFLSQCDNPGYSVGNNRAANVTSDSSSWILFLNDDLELMDGFIQHMFDLGQAKQNAAAVGCKLVSEDGSKLLEAGSIIWSDATCLGYGRDSMEPYAPEFSYTRPTDYVSGACLMTRKTVFLDYEGFDGATFPAFYEDTDFQMHLNHDLGKQVWFQPLAVAHHHEHGTFGAESVKLMLAGQKAFAKKWAGPLQHHLERPLRKDPVQVLQARDNRRKRLPNILYVDELIPEKKLGAGYGRALDNLVMISELGHKVTATATALPKGGDLYCEAKCQAALQQASIEVMPPLLLSDNSVQYVMPEDHCAGVDTLLENRKDFYSIIIVSRPATFQKCKAVFRRHCRLPNCTVIYDSEALGYCRDEMLLDVARKGLVSNETAGALHVYEERLDKERRKELRHLLLADVITAVSSSEKKQVTNMTDVYAPVFVIGHTMELNPTVSSFENRSGILFVAAFHGSMYYNGDAIWYFLQHVYPLVLKEATESLPLFIAGRGIPNYLQNMVKSMGYEGNVTFIESPSQLKPLYEKARIFIAPHLYGAGVQYKVRYQ